MMNKQHEVQNLTFEGQWMILTVDHQTYRLPIDQASSRLAQASDSDRNHYQVSPSGYGIHWTMLDEDLSINGLIRLAQAQPVQSTVS
ncbi:DUF2442 domain-containing protein [Kovacikia minuta CCNUW1]|uniref:DUF2442 domain-containing protein n=1 Tax=Kovacikia minuta TaxID=2931930 RepID=UPI001CCFBB86|nr:DUF2442 domain-containing protein [Kovacikia minuta]UBF24175.1 DUF2442 domain-containing protein [Kovacikia minuta CCNUW1]